MSYEDQLKFEELVRRYLRTFPPLNKRGNGNLAKFKRLILATRLYRMCGGNEQIITESLEKMANKVLLTQ